MEQRARRQAARGDAPGTTAPGSRTRGWRPIAREVFDALMPGPNQLGVLREDVNVTARRSAAPCPTGAITEAGLRRNIRVGVQYLEAWLRGNGCVPLYNLMEDAATAEICRAQVWQWLRHGARTERRRAGRPRALPTGCSSEELDRIHGEVGAARASTGGRVPDARRGCSSRLTTSDTVRRVPDAARLRAARRSTRAR